jgi:RES domain-containing protein
LRLKLVDLHQLGVDERSYGSLNYETCQAIGAAVAFLEHDGLIVPSARSQCENLVLFTENHSLSCELEAVGEEDVDWQAWARENGLL